MLGLLGDNVLMQYDASTILAYYLKEAQAFQSNWGHSSNFAISPHPVPNADYDLTDRRATTTASSTLLRAGPQCNSKEVRLGADHTITQKLG
jgi:hypothetical protein